MMDHPDEPGRAAPPLLAWESEGGAGAAPHYAVDGDGDGGGAMLQRLGAALMCVWHLLPTHLRRTLYEAAAQAPAGDSRRTVRRDLARFLRDHQRTRQRNR